MISVIRIYLLLAKSSNDSGPGVTIHASKEKRSDGKFRIFSVESKYFET